VEASQPGRSTLLHLTNRRAKNPPKNAEKNPPKNFVFTDFKLTHEEAAS
jgi:hypothetical protein